MGQIIDSLVKTNTSESTRRRSLTDSTVEQKLCALCGQEIDSRDYSDHVKNCDRQKSFSSTSISSSNKQNLVSKKNHNKITPHRRSCIEVNSNDEAADYSTSRAAIPPLTKIKYKHCTLCFQAIDELDYEKHISSCDLFDELMDKPSRCRSARNLDTNENTERDGKSTVSAHVSKKIKYKECIICFQAIDEIDYADHVSSCGLLEESIDTSSHYQSAKNININENTERHGKSSVSEDLSKKIKYEECIICFQAIDEIDYADHVSSCSLFEESMNTTSRYRSARNVDTDKKKTRYQPLKNPMYSPQNTIVNKTSSSSINVCSGDLITQTTDVIVVCSSSEYLFNTICKAAGDSVKTLFEKEATRNPKPSVIAVEASGQVTAKKIYFLEWKMNDNTALLRKSIEKFVSDAIEYAINENYQSIAFPAIGCGKFGCSVSVVAQTMVEEAHRKLLTNPISVLFVIQPGRNDIYDEFQKQINLLPQSQLPQVSKTISATVGKGVIEVEKGDITTQNVDVIIGSSSSTNLIRAIIEAAGNDVQTAYDAECQNNPHTILISTVPGDLPCKRIFFLKWKPVDDETTLRQSLVDLIWTVMQHLILYNFTSIAFPAIGCGKHGCSIDLVVKTMMKEMKNQLTMRNLPVTVKFVIHPDQQNVYDEFCKQVLTIQNDAPESLDHQLPSTWVNATQNKIRFVLSTTTDEYKSILTNFDQTMKKNYTQIIQIERIQNERWYTQYLAHSRDFKKRLNTDTEKRLYHGCPEPAANLIIEDCFNRSFAGVNGTAYGVGVYFSSKASYSHGYAPANVNGQRRIFVARVLVGKTTKGNGSMKTRPLGFDSTTDEKHIFVTYHDAQAYAEYLITYK